LDPTIAECTVFEQKQNDFSAAWLREPANSKRSSAVANLIRRPSLIARLFLRYRGTPVVQQRRRFNGELCSIEIVEPAL